MKTYTSEEITAILNILHRDWDFIYSENKKQLISQKVVNHYNTVNNEYYFKLYPDLFKELLNYQFEFSTDGDHKNDGQMVEYTFTFTNPDGIESVFSTEMCLMVGWNHYNDVEIN